MLIMPLLNFTAAALKLKNVCFFLGNLLQLIELYVIIIKL